MRAESFFERLRSATEVGRSYLFSAPQIQAALGNHITKDVYLAYLAEAYHHVKHTVPLMLHAKTHLDERHDAFKLALDSYIAEETGHEAWILNDIAAAGGDADRVRKGAPGIATEIMVAFAYDYISRVNPMGFFGMVFVLEGTSVALAQRGAASVAETLGLGPECFTYLNSHGALDQGHMAFFEDLMGQVTDAADQDAIIHMARRMFVLFGAVFRSIPMIKEPAYEVCE